MHRAECDEKRNSTKPCDYCNWRTPATGFEFIKKLADHTLRDHGDKLKHKAQVWAWNTWLFVRRILHRCYIDTTNIYTDDESDKANMAQLSGESESIDEREYYSEDEATE